MKTNSLQPTIHAAVLLLLSTLNSHYSNLYATGGPGYAVHVGAGSYVRASSTAALDSYPITVSAWVRPVSAASTARGVITKIPISGTNGWQIFFSNGQIHAAYGTASSSAGTQASPLNTSGPTLQNAWHHIAFTVDSTGAKLYLDGVPADSKVWTGTPGATTSTDELRLGLYSDNSGAFSGDLDEVTIWNTALTTNQIQFNMNHSLTGNESGLVLYWRCDENAPGNLEDSAPLDGDNVGSLVGGVTFTPSGIAPFTAYAETLAASVTVSNATLSGYVNPGGTNTSAWFEWGTTTNYGNKTATQSIVPGTDLVAINQALNNLLSGIAYHYRAIASNQFGIGTGSDQAFSLSNTFYDTGTALPQAYAAQTPWGDYNDDGRLDILFSDGTLSSNAVTGFIDSNLSLVSGYWGDYDNDDRLDVLYVGNVLSVYRYNGAKFIGFNVVPLGSVYYSGAWGDFDNDGRMDFLASGLVSTLLESQLWRNTNGGFALAAALSAATTVAVGDFDNDGRQDVIVGGNNVVGTQVLRNSPGGFNILYAGLPQLSPISFALGDYDNDGRLDILITGLDTNNTPTTQIWRNTGNGFTNINAGLPGVYGGSAAWGDYDNDGRLDVLLSGAASYTTNGPANRVAQVWRNTGSGFTNLNVGMPGVSGRVAWGDYDNDGRLDILLTGVNDLTQTVAQIWRNITPVANTPPTAPTGLSVTTVGNVVPFAGDPPISALQFSWNAATDAQTPSSGLTYNLRVGTTPGGSDLVSPLSDTATGFRRIVDRGNCGSRLSRTIVGLPLGQPIYWSVQAIDTAFAGGPFAAEAVFNLAAVPGTNSAVNGGIPGDLNGDGIVDQFELNTVLSNYYASSLWLLMTNVAGLGGTNVTFALSNSTAGSFSVQYSTNLSNWVFLGPATPRYLFTDTNAPAVPQRLYRLRWP